MTIQDRKPKTIADLSTDTSQPILIGKSLLNECKNLRDKIRRLEERRKAEMELLKAGGYDYGGKEQFAEMMQRVGRLGL